MISWFSAGHQPTRVAGESASCWPALGDCQVSAYTDPGWTVRTDPRVAVTLTVAVGFGESEPTPVRYPDHLYQSI